MLSHMALCLFLYWPLLLSAVTDFGVTYDFSGGRFGDCLLSYLHAKWIAYEKQIPLYYRPFVYSSHLILDQEEKHLADLRDEPRLRVLLGNGPPNPRIHLPLLYICPYFPEIAWERNHIHRFPYWFTVDWKNPQFRQLILSLIQPKKPLLHILPPQDRISIAIHYRDGGGHDDQAAREEWPLKFPPLHFYIDSLNAAIELCQHKPLYCYLFTDSLNPDAIVQELQKGLLTPSDILFDYRTRQKGPRSNVLEDFFSLFHFDILIRPQSNFSLIPSLLHDYLAVYAPEDIAEEKITEVSVTINEELLYKRLL
ncbi:MAG: hypothetical protein HY069_01560 [Chlamydiia bacterium]|nr:hypothetical protein [Chlamydiia bacterium]